MEEFLKELSELSKKHGLYIEGCGCCGSPIIVDDDSTLATNLYYDSGEDKYKVMED